MALFPGGDQDIVDMDWKNLEFVPGLDSVKQVNLAPDPTD